MKCVVLAGGKGNRLWPLSRKEYPKQFMNIENNMSLLQKTIERNKKFCDEFIIITNIKYSFIIDNQMKKMEDIKYKVLYETEGRNTAPAIALSCLCCNKEELIYVVSSDHIINGQDYERSILEAKELAIKNNIVIFGIKPTGPNTGYGYIKYNENDVLEFKEKPDYETAIKYFESNKYLWNSGMFLFKASVLLNELREYRNDIYSACEKAIAKIQNEYDRKIFTKEVMASIPSESIDYAVLEKSSRVKVVTSNYNWCDVGNLEVISKYLGEEDKKFVVNNNCTNTTIINRVDKKLVVANSLDDTIIVNTDDAVYISKKGKSDNIKSIMEENELLYSKYFDENVIHYRPWGYYEILKEEEKFEVKKIIIYPKHKISLQKHKYRSEHWVIMRGTATITLNNVTKNYTENESIYVPIGEIHMIENNTEEDVYIIETAIGNKVSEDDIIRY